jgi:long-chain acyl-CoA synthetase
MNQDIDSIIQEICLEEPSFRLKNETIRGVNYKCFDSEILNLNDYFKLGLSYQNNDMIVFQDERYSFKDCYKLSSAFANSLIQNFNVKKGDRVAIASRNYPEWIYTFIAITSLGAIAVPLNSWWTGSELEYALEDCGANIAIVDDKRYESIKDFAKKKKLELITIRCNKKNKNNWNSLIRPYVNKEMPNKEIKPDDDATIFYTSGSTGHPKGVCSTHRSIISTLLQWALVATARAAKDKIQPDKTVQPSCMITIPLFHVTGSHSQFMLSFLSGRKMVMLYKWDPLEALKLIESEKIISVSGVPTMTLEIMRHPDRHNYDLSSLKDLSGGGAARPSSHVIKLKKEFPNAKPGLGYGLTETNAAGAVISGDEYIERPGSTGKPMKPLTELIICDENNKKLPRKETGEIFIKTPSNFRCYWNDTKATKEAFFEGWFKTGDIGYLDQDNYLFIVDRAKDIVIRGGENISCLEVEDIINNHPLILEASVYGIPDERLGEVLCCSISIKGGEVVKAEDLKSYLKKYLAPFKVPTHVDSHKKQLPRTASGKIYKLHLRQELEKKINSN